MNVRILSQTDSVEVNVKYATDRGRAVIQLTQRSRSGSELETTLHTDRMPDDQARLAKAYSEIRKLHSHMRGADLIPDLGCKCEFCI